jgi:hypothetical protein
MQNEKKYFLSQDSMLDADSADFAVTQNSWVNMENFRTGSTDDGVIGTVESIGSTTTINSQTPGSNYLAIGSADDVENARFVTLYKDLNGNDDKIECTYSNTNTTYTVLKSQDIINTQGGYSVEQFEDKVFGIAPHQLVFTNITAVQNMQAGDIITITNANCAGTYTVSSILGSSSIIVVQNVTTTTVGITYNNVRIAPFPPVINGSSSTYFRVSIPIAFDSLLFPRFTQFSITNSTYPPYNSNSYQVSNITTTSNFPYNFDIGTLNSLLYSNVNGEMATFTFKINANISVNRNQNIILISSGLNFTKEPIHSARIVNGCLYWADSTNNQPRKINIESGIKSYNPTFNTQQPAYIFPLGFDEITVIKPTAPLSPNFTKQTDTNFTSNFIFNQSFEFAFQFVYNDNETSVIGTYSAATRLNFKADTFNNILVTMDIGQKIPNTVKIINLIARVQDGTTQGGNYSVIIKTWDIRNAVELSQIQAQNLGTVLSFNFYNNITGQTIPEDDTLRAFDNVPIYSETLEVAKNRLFLANNTEGYNTPSTTSLSIGLANPIQPAITTKSLRLFSTFVNFDYTNGSYISDSRYFLSWTIFRGDITPSGYYAIISTISFPAGGIYTQAPPTTIDDSDLLFLGTNINQILQSIMTQYFPFMLNQFTGGNVNGQIIPGWFLGSPRANILNDYYLPPGGANSIPTPNVNVQNTSISKYNTLTQNSVYKFGVVFYDYAMRKCGVVNNSSSQQILINSFNDSLVVIAPSTIRFSSPASINIQKGDSLVITNSSGINGSYIVTSVSLNTGVGLYVTEVQVFSTLTAMLTTATISIYRIPSLQISTPARDFNYSTTYSAFQWNLSNSNAVNEIPDWAYYYTPVRTLNLRTRLFIQSYTPTVKYATRNSSGAYVYANVLYPQNAVGIAFDTQNIALSGLGYSYNPGDSCLFVKSGSSQVYDLPVIAQDGNYIIVKPQNIGDLTNAKFIFELYTPYKSTEQEPYYEVGEMYTVNNPTKSNRSYQTTSGFFNGDSYILLRNLLPNSGNIVSYFAGAMSPDDLYWKRWDNDGGKINFVTKLGQTVKEQYISWSDTFIPNTAINGLSTFRVENQKSVPQDCGSISKLQLTSKIQNEGTVMLSICTNETNSMYLGETQITDSTGGTQFFSATSQVISTINTLKGSFGTINPEAVTEFRGSVFYPDANRGVWVQYSANGLFAISNYKMTRFWKLFFKQYLSMTKAQIEALGSRPYLFSTVDASHLELLISIPKLLDTPPEGYLPDYPNQIYPFDIWDGQGKTIVYCLENVNIQPHWQGSYSFNPEQFICIVNNLYSLKNGNLYLHNQTNSFNNFYGQQYNSKIMVVSNQVPQRPKVYNNVSVESNMKPLFTYFYNNYPYLQTSDLENIDYKELEGVFYAALYRNKIIPSLNPLGYTTNGLLTGENLRNVAMKIMLEFNPTTSPTELKFLNIGYDISRGHTT